MRKRRYIRTYTGVLLTAGLLSFTWTEGFTVTHENVVLIDPKSLFFVLLFSIIYSFMVDQDRSIHARSIGLGAHLWWAFSFFDWRPTDTEATCQRTSGRLELRGTAAVLWDSWKGVFGCVRSSEGA